VDLVRLTFVVHGPPVPKARARVVTDKRGTRGVTPKKTADYEKVVALVALAARSQNYLWPWQDKAARFGVLVKLHISSHEGDGDNYYKALTDACKSVLWVDDRQIDDGRFVKTKVDKGAERAEVEVWVL
jgi:Holliday junction resolvase RusA-like endonuclease